MPLSVLQVVERVEKRMAAFPVRLRLKRIDASPTHVAEIAERIRELGEAITRIEQQLSRPWEGPNAAFRDRFAYERWRKRARAAAKYLREEKDDLGLALKDARKRIEAGAIGLADVTERSLLEAAYSAMRGIKDRLGWESLGHDTCELISLIRDHLQ